jgi:hypothetical protein
MTIPTYFFSSLLPKRRMKKIGTFLRKSQILLQKFNLIFNLKVLIELKQKRQTSKVNNKI